MTFIIFVIVINLMAIKLTAIKNKACNMKFYDRKKEIVIAPTALNRFNKTALIGEVKRNPPKYKHLRVGKRVGKEERNFT